MLCVRACVCNIAVFYLVIITVQYVTEFNTMRSTGAYYFHNNIAVKYNVLICYIFSNILMFE